MGRLRKCASVLLLMASYAAAASPVSIELVKDITPSGHTFQPAVQRAVVAGGLLYFPRSTGQGAEIWRSDGSEAGTFGVAVGDSVETLAPRDQGVAYVRIGPGATPFSHVHRIDANLVPGAAIWGDTGSNQYLQVIPGDGVLSNCNDTGHNNICASAPGQAQRPIVATIAQDEGDRVRPVGTIGSVAVFGGSGVSGTSGRGIWRSDGTVPGTFRIVDARLSRDLGGGPTPATLHQGRLWFIACSDQPGCEFYSTDGTVAGTQRLASADIPQGVMKPLGNGLALALGSLSGTSALLYSDGTTEGTRRLVGYAPSHRVGLAVAGNMIHFVSDTGAFARYYVSDGTLAGTHVVTLPDQILPMPDAPVALDDDTVIFRCTTPETGEEFCITDGQGNSTTLHDVAPGPLSSIPRFLGLSGDSAYYSATDRVHGYELWRVRLLSDLIFGNGFEGGTAPEATPME